MGQSTFHTRRVAGELSAVAVSVWGAVETW